MQTAKKTIQLVAGALLVALLGTFIVTTPTQAQPSQGVAEASTPIDPEEAVESLNNLMDNPPENRRKVLRDVLVHCPLSDGFFELESLGEQLTYAMGQLDGSEDETAQTCLAVLQELKERMEDTHNDIAGIGPSELPQSA